MRKKVPHLGLTAAALCATAGFTVTTVDAAPTISCDTALEAPFAAAVAMIASNPTTARRAFRRMAADHPACAILHWGLAETAGDTAERRSEWLNAVYYGATSGATREEWDLISSVAPDRK